MAGRIPDKFIDELLARVDIVDVIGQRVQLKKAGRDWSARCPFHDERSPSFTVSPAKQFYHCFGCGAHGSAIRFLMEYDRLEFVDAVEELAGQLGMKVPHEGGARRAPQEDSTDLFALLDAAAGYYRRELAKSDKARAYFDSRGLDAQTIERFGLGYAPDQWDALKNALGTTPQRIALLEKTGMLTHGDRGTKYDRFRDRVMFPIQDRRGRVIAFGGRSLVASSAKRPEAGADDGADASGAGDARKEGPKYLNSPETPLFHKGRELFGLWQVRQAHAKIPRLIVVEGYMDVIALFQHGLAEAVATLGTATTRDHAELLFRNCADVYFCFDGDRAGRQAGWRAVESVLPRMRDGRQAFFLFLPEGEDPDSLVRKESRAGFEQRLIVVEGYMDVIALFQHGLAEAVATLGTATTRDHAELLFRNCADVYFCFDGDRAGRQAGWRAVESVLPRMRDGRQAFFLFLPEGEDPDSLVRKESRAGFEQRLKAATPLSEFFFAELGKDVNLSSLDGKARLAERARPLLSQIPDGAFRDLMLAELDRQASVRLQVEAAAAAPARRRARPQERTLVRTAVALLVQNPGFARAIEPPHPFSTLRQPGIPLLVELIALCRERDEIATAGILEHFAGRDELRALEKLAVMEFPGAEDEWRAEFLDALAQLDRQTQRQRIDELLEKSKSAAGLDAAEKDELRRLLPANKRLSD